MSDNTGAARDAAASAPLHENQYVSELLSILQENGRDSSGLSALLSHVSEMESFVKRAEETITEMKSQLSEMKEVQNHPIKTALQNAIKALESKVAEVKAHLSELKGNIVDGCKNAVAAFKEKGASALDKLASFFNVKGEMQDWKKSNLSIIQSNNKTVVKIEAFANEYHSAGRAIKNMARLAVGKPPLDKKKEAGKLAKAMSAPYKAQNTVLAKLNKSLDKAIASLERLGNTVEQKREHRQVERSADTKPSLLGQLQNNLEKVEQMKREAPVPERAKAKGAEI